MRLGTASICEPAKVANAHETAWKHMQQETPDELIGTESHLPFLVSMRVILPAEGDFAIDETDEAMIGNRHPMGVTRQVMQDMLGPAEWAFGIDDPVLAE